MNNPKDFEEMMRQLRGETSIENEELIHRGGGIGIDLAKEALNEHDGQSFKIFDMENMDGIKAQGQESLKDILEQRQEAYENDDREAMRNLDSTMESTLGNLIHRMVEQQEQNPDNLIEAMNKFADEVMLENAAVKFDSAQDAFEAYEAIKEWLDEIYETEAPKYIDVPVALLIEFPDEVTYNEAQSIVATYEAVVVNG